MGFSRRMKNKRNHSNPNECVPLSAFCIVVDIGNTGCVTTYFTSRVVRRSRSNPYT